MKYAEVIISIAHKNVDRIFNYIVPESFEADLRIGMRVIVPFGKMKRAQEGFVIGIKDKSEYKVKDILNVEKRYFR